jgi:hypothetical protein
MVLPAIQHRFKIFMVRPLDGDFMLAQRPSFTREKWMDGTFQAGFDSYLEDHIGFRNLFVRLNNQIEFSLFSKANAEGVVVGKDHMVFEYDYIRAYTGGDFIGINTIDKKLGRMKFLQEFLKSQFDIDFIFILEPSKARFYHDYIPKRYLKDGLSISNYEYISQKVDELGIRHIDLNSYFMQMKDTARYLLYPKYGIHWSEYTMPLIADTLTKTIEQIRNIKLPQYEIEEIIVKDSLADSDYDVGKTMNLLWKLPHPEMPYPVFSFEDNNPGTKPMVLAVADSYYWNFFNTRIPKHLFANEAFWYFNAKVYPDFYFGEKWVNELDLQSEIEKQDIILLSVTERFLYKFDWGFIDQVYELYGPEYSGDLIYKYENLIRMDASWFDRIEKESKKENISLELAIRNEARFQAFTEEPEVYLTWYGLEHYREVINNNEEWSKMVKEKAGENGITFDEQLTEDADYVFKSDYPVIHAKYHLIKDFENQIKSDHEWLNKVKNKAEFYHTDLHSMIGADAEYMAKQELQEIDPHEAKTNVFIALIKNDPDWLESIRIKAEEQGKSMEQAIRDDARWMAEQELGKK